MLRIARRILSSVALLGLVASVLDSSPARAETASAADAKPARDRPSLALSWFHSLSSSGYVRVREFNLVGDKLALTRDLGLRAVNSAELDGVLPVGTRGAFRALFTLTRFGGDATLASDTWFNGTLYARDGHVDIGSTQYYRGTILYQHRVFGRSRSEGHVLVQGGLAVDALDFHIAGPLSPHTVKTEKRENFARQLFPMPMIGAVVSEPVLPHTRVYGEVRLALMRDLPTPYQEGGHMSFTQTDLDSIVGAAYRIAPVELHLAVRQSFFFERTESHEDTNEFQLATQGFELGVAYSP